MSLPHLIMWAVVVCVGLPAAFRNPTALALTLSWLAGETTWLITGNSFPLSVYFMADIAVVAVIMAKPEACNSQPYQNTVHQLKCLLLERSVADRVVMLIFPIMWCIYTVPIHPYYAWFALWLLTIAQFLAAGVEAFLKFRRARAAVVARDIPRSGLEYALAWRLAGHG